MPFRPTHPALAEALAARNYLEPTPVQDAVLADEADGRDLLVSSQTGSGKTVAYGLALASTLLGEADRMGDAGEPLALVVAPTRELALQVRQELGWLYEKAGARIVTCVGGMDPRAEQRALTNGAHIVVGTPGRLRDHLERGRLRIANLKALVLDEADEMLNLGFREDLEFILEATPEERRTLLFSATLPKTIVSMTKRYQHNALRIEASADPRASHADIEYRAIRIAPNDTEHAVVNLLRHTDAQVSIVFCNTRESVRHLHSGLLDRGFSAVALSGELGQAERIQALQSLRDGRARVCVATDVAARGIDLPNLGLVIHAELPNDAETLQHRSGRTGRAGRKGISVLLVPLSRRRKADRLITDARVRPQWGPAPSAEEIRRLDRERMFADPLLTEEPSEDDLEVGRTLLANRTPAQIAAALARVYRMRLPEPEEVFDPGFAGESRPARGEGKRERDHAERGERGEKPSRRPSGPSVWFHLDIGRKNSADPKWLLPLLCRRGKISREDIGAIRIFDKETKFEISEASADRFFAAAEGMDDDITISRADGAPTQERGSRDGRGPKLGNKPRAQPSLGRRNDEGKPRGKFHAKHNRSGPARKGRPAS